MKKLTIKRGKNHFQHQNVQRSTLATETEGAFRSSVSRGTDTEAQIEAETEGTEGFNSIFASVPLQAKKTEAVAEAEDFSQSVTV